MSADSCISLQNVSKRYKLYRRPSDKLKQLLSFGSKRYYVDFPALENIDLTVNKGETVGIIGHNGAGKSTLLTLLSGISKPSAGTVIVRGKMVSLLELGSGLNAEFTGRENIFLYGLVLGMTRAEIAAKFEEIVTFADIGTFIEQPVRTYSNGMMLRLAFAVVAHVDAEILIFDEALAVGDSSFQYKCFRRIQELQKLGATILLVSHNHHTITSICSRIVILDHGKKYFDGPIKDAFWAYNRLVSSKVQKGELSGDPGAIHQHPDNNGIVLLEGFVLDQTGERRTEFQAGEKCWVHLRFVVKRDILSGSVGVLIQNSYATNVYGYNTVSDPALCFRWPVNIEQQVSISLDLNLAPGMYHLSVSLNHLEDEKIICLCSKESFVKLSILGQPGVFGTGNLFARFESGLLGQSRGA